MRKMIFLIEIEAMIYHYLVIRNKTPNGTYHDRKISSTKIVGHCLSFDIHTR